MIIKFLKNNLVTRQPNKKYKEFRASKKMQGNELHHFIGSRIGSKKLNDYLLAEISKTYHTVITVQRRADEYEQLSMLTNCIEGLIDYVEKLEADILEKDRLITSALKSKEVIVEMLEKEK